MRYVNEEVDQVVLVYNSFVSPLVQRVAVAELLPVPARGARRRRRRGGAASEARMALDFFFEPEPRNILERLLPVYVETQLYRALLESAASFFGAQGARCGMRRRQRASSSTR